MADPTNNSPAVSQDDFKAWRNCRRATTHAENMTNPFWEWCVKNEADSYQANDKFNGPSSFAYKPCWSFERFGRSTTKLPDGRVIYIAGEHEDHYDPDFFIYNDVIVVAKDGKASIYGYPEKDFPATDFHSATQVDDSIILIGSLGYPDDRDSKKTPVYKLDLSDFSISEIITSEGPGWIHDQTAVYDKAKHCIIIDDGKRWTKDKGIIESFSRWQLDLSTKQWTLLEKRPWSQYRFERTDGEASEIFQVRMHHLMPDTGMFALEQFKDNPEILESLKEMQDEQKKALAKANPKALDQLYLSSIPHKKIPQSDDEDDFTIYQIEVDGIILKFVEDMYYVTLTIKGQLAPEKLETIIKETEQQLAAVMGSIYMNKQIQWSQGCFTSKHSR